MKPKSIWTLCGVGVLECLIAVLIIDREPTESDRPATEPYPRRDQASEEPMPVIAPAGPSELSAGSAIPPVKSLRRSVRSAQSGDRTASKTTSAPENPPALDPAAREQLGRMALSYVGADPVADGVWVWLINDPELSPKVRTDLIEDLNENGFSDGAGSVATVADLPLIESRLLLIEEHMPVAMDDANAAAFAEVYQDLVNLWWQLNGL